MKSTKALLLVALLLPVIGYSQSFRMPDLSPQSDHELFTRKLVSSSPVLQQLYAHDAIKTNMNPEEAKALIASKLAALNNEDLNRTYASLSPNQLVRVGVILYLLMNGLSNTPDIPGYDYKSKFGGGAGVFLMATLAQFVLMPELSLLFRSYGQQYSGSDDYSATFTYLTLAFTAMYMIHAGTMSILAGLSPNLGYALSGKDKYGDEKEDIEFGDGGANRLNFGLGLTAGIMLQNAVMIRLMYNLGLSKIYKDGDPRMYYFALVASIPLWTLKK